jgi:hypothetical protein
MAMWVKVLERKLEASQNDGVHLSDLKLGLEAALNISDAMDNLANSLFLNKVLAIWEKDAYPSSRSKSMIF